MRIAFVCCEYPPGPHGGIGTVTRLLARSLVRAGHEVRVAGVYSADYGGLDYEVDEGVRVWRLRQAESGGSWVKTRLGLYRRFSEWSSGGEIDLVEVPDWQGWAAGWPRLRVPIVARLHGSATYFSLEAGERPRRMEYWLERMSLHRVDYLCAVSKYVGGRTRSIFGMRGVPFEVLYNPVEELPAVSEFSSRSSGMVVFTGTLAAKKGVIALIDAWRGVHRAVGDATLHLYGKDGRGSAGENMTQFLMQRLEREEHDSVFFHGHVSRGEIFGALALARVAVFPSYSEACGMGAIEAMMSGCPTVHSELSSGPEIVRDGVDGILVDPENPASITAAIVGLLKDEAKSKGFGVRGRARAIEKFCMTTMLPRNEEFYDRCIWAHRRGDAVGKGSGNGDMGNVRRNDAAAMEAFCRWRGSPERKGRGG